MSLNRWWCGVMVAATMTGTHAAEIKPIPLYSAPKPVAEGMRELVEKDASGRTAIRNVTAPTLTPFFPERGRGNGAAVIVLPGGGFSYLSWESEGTMVAQRLAEKGVTAFVLKYRLQKTAEDKATSEREMWAQIRKYLDTRAQADAAADNPLRPAALVAAEDTSAAIRLVRHRAQEWNVDPQRVGLLGFSAGAIAATYVSTGNAERPDFAGLIYGALDQSVPNDAPPVFIAASVDDGLQPPAVTVGIFNAWLAAGRSAELHLYEGGGHGYGILETGRTSDHWFDQFVSWMESRKLFAAAEPEAAAEAVKAAVDTDLGGSWVFSVTTNSGTTMPKATLVRKGHSLSGTLHSQVLGDCTIAGTVDTGIFTMNVESPLLTLVYVGSADTKDTLKGTVSSNGQAMGTFTAKRE